MTTLVLWPYAAGLWLSAASLAAAAVPSTHHKRAAAADVRTFDIDFGDMLQLDACVFTLVDASGGRTPLEVDRQRSIDSNVALLVPNSKRGNLTLVWQTVTLAGDKQEGSVRILLK